MSRMIGCNIANSNFITAEHDCRILWIGSQKQLAAIFNWKLLLHNSRTRLSYFLQRLTETVGSNFQVLFYTFWNNKMDKYFQKILFKIDQRIMIKAFSQPLLICCGWVAVSTFMFSANIKNNFKTLSMGSSFWFLIKRERLMSNVST